MTDPEETATKPGAYLRSSAHNVGEVEQKSPGERAPGLSLHAFRIRLVGLLLGLGLALLVFFILPAELSMHAKITAATAVLMGVWWMTEALPIPATALIPLIVFPLASDRGLSEVGGSYGSDVIFLFMGGFLLAIAMQRWNLHRRIALLILRAMGDKPSAMVAGFMIATGFLSMWVSNTATAVMMLPIGVSVLLLVSRIEQETTEPAKNPAPAQSTEGMADGNPLKSNFGTALMLGIAYSASVGSLATLIGTPPNTLLAGYMEKEHNITIGFGTWMLVGLPLALVMLVITWLLLTKVLFKPEIDRIPGGKALIADELAALGPTSAGEKRVFTIFILAALSWVFIPMIFPDNTPISDAGIAMVVGFLLFVMPAGANRGVRLLDWESAVSLPWGVLLLFGGGLALSAEFTASGLTEWIGESTKALGGLPLILMVLIVVIGVIFLTEITSNTATAATFLPLAGGVAMGLDLNPMMLAIPVALAATCAFMLPVATPPNAVAYGSGYVTIGQMVRGGIWLNLIGVVLITLVTMTLAVWVFGL